MSILTNVGSPHKLTSVIVSCIEHEQLINTRAHKVLSISATGPFFMCHIFYRPESPQQLHINMNMSNEGIIKACFTETPQFAFSSQFCNVNLFTPVLLRSAIRANEHDLLQKNWQHCIATSTFYFCPSTSRCCPCLTSYGSRVILFLNRRSIVHHREPALCERVCVKHGKTARGEQGLDPRSSDVQFCIATLTGSKVGAKLCEGHERRRRRTLLTTLLP